MSSNDNPGLAQIPSIIEGPSLRRLASTVDPVTKVLKTGLKDISATGTIAVVASASIVLALDGVSSYAIELSGSWTGSLLVEGSLGGTNYNGLLVFRAGVGEKYTNRMTGTGAAQTPLYRGTDGALAFVRVRANSDFVSTLGVAVIIRSGAGTAITFVGNGIATTEEQAARQGAAFSLSNAAPMLGTITYLRTIINNPAGSGKNLLINKITFGSGGANSMRTMRINNPTTVIATAITPSNAMLSGGLTTIATAFGDTSLTSLAPTPAASAFGVVPTTGLTREVNLPPVIVPPGSSIGYQVYNPNTLAAADAAFTMNWTEEFL